MSDLLTRFVDALESIATSLKTTKSAPAAAPAPTKPDDTAKKAAAAAAEAAKKAAAAAAATSGGKGATATAPASTTKAPGGKRTLEEVRDKVRTVAKTEGLGKPDAVNILEEEGGVKTVAELKPENYDAVYEACEVALANAGKPKTDETDDIM